MALILNLETATTVCSVSLAKDGESIAFKELDSGYSHAENLTLFIQDVISSANIAMADIDAIAVSKGPGSYTGLRIGVSTAKGLAYSLNKPLISVDTLQHLSLALSESTTRNFDAKSLFCPMLDARRMEVFCGIYDINNQLIQPISAEIIDSNSFKKILDTQELVFFGNGAEKCKEALSNHPNATFIKNIHLSAKNMNKLSYKAFKSNNFEDIAYFEPYYLKDFMLNKPKL